MDILEDRKIEEVRDNKLSRIETWLLTKDGFAEATELLRIKLQELPVRPMNVIRNLYGGMDPTLSFFQSFFRMNESDFKDLRNCGRKSVSIIIEFRKRYLSLLSKSASVAKKDSLTNNDTVVSGEVTLDPADLIELESKVKLLNTALSTRCLSVVKALFFEAGDDTMKVYNRLSSDGFKGIAIRNIGRKTYPEFQEWCDKFRGLVQEYLTKTNENQNIKPDVDVTKSSDIETDNTIPVENSQRIDKRLVGLIPDFEKRTEIIELMQSLGHFPYFLSIKAFIDTRLDERDTVIMKEGIRLKKNQSINTTIAIASKLSLSAQRVSQMRLKLFNRLIVYSRKLRKLFPEETCPYKCVGEDVSETINKQEGTEFNLDFSHWIIGSIFKEYKYIGNPYHTLTTPFSKRGFVAIVPFKLLTGYDFKSFISRLGSLLVEKREDVKKVSLRPLIAKDIKRGYDDFIPEINLACKSIINLHYNLEIKHGCIVLGANAHKLTSELVYEIIRKNGAPMTVKQLASTIKARYPDRKISLTSLGNSALRHPKVLPIGRSNTYTLKSWKNGAERGGTIREFAIEYLKSLNTPIAPEIDICEYVRRFRPTSSDRSIISNLLQESTHNFALYLKDGVRFIGISRRKYPESYKATNGHKRSAEESMKILENFILTKGRYPLNTSKDKEERRLYRFVGNRRYSCSRGTISAEEADQWYEFEEKYKEYNLSMKGDNGDKNKR